MLLSTAVTDGSDTNAEPSTMTGSLSSAATGTLFLEVEDEAAIDDVLRVLEDVTGKDAEMEKWLKTTRFLMKHSDGNGRKKRKCVMIFVNGLESTETLEQCKIGMCLMLFERKRKETLKRSL
jgi:hypothetical protein